MRVVPYLSFRGDCAEAMRFYENVIGGRIAVMQTFGQSPMGEQVPAAMRDMIIHARIERDGAELLMASDSPPGMEEAFGGFSISLQVASAAEAERLFAGLGAGGEVPMPLQETFWAERFGMVRDRFGVRWMVNFDGVKAG